MPSIPVPDPPEDTRTSAGATSGIASRAVATEAPATDGSAAEEPRAVPDDHARVASLSPSRAADFMTCPLLYRYRVVDRIPEAPSREASRGTLVHAVLEALFDLPAADRTLERAAGLLPGTWDTLLTTDESLQSLFGQAADPDGELASFLDESTDLLRRYFTLEDPARLEPAERELVVSVPLESGLQLRGIVDRIDVAPTGEVRVVDYKTGNAPSEVFEAKALFQMKFYALVLWRLRGSIPTLLQLVYLGGEGTLLRYTPDERDLRATERKLDALWQAIARAYERRDFRPSPSRLCHWCDHQAICPAFGGTPPPLPDPLPVPAMSAGDETDDLV